MAPAPEYFILSYDLVQNLICCPVPHYQKSFSCLCEELDTFLTISNLADYNWLGKFSYAVWILSSHTAAKISSAAICQVRFQEPKQRQLVPSETFKYLRHLHQTVTYDVKSWGTFCGPGLAVGGCKISWNY